MSIGAIEAKLVVPEFSAELINVALVAAEGKDTADEFRHRQLELMSRHNNPLQMYFLEKVIAFGKRHESQLSDKWRFNYLIGHAALRSAISEDMPLPFRDHVYVHEVAQFAHLEPNDFANDIKEEYARHPSMQALLEKLAIRNDGDTAGASLILGVYGAWANPRRKRRSFPSVQLETSKRSPAEKRQEAAYGLAKRYGSR